MSEPTPSAWPSYSVTPHQADGGCPVSGLVILGLGGALAGLALGVLAGIISQWFYLVLLFPICIGLGVGVAGRFAVKAGKVRNSLLCGVAGFLAGCFAVLAMHYYGYFMFEKELAVIPPGVRKIAANFDQLQAKRAELPEEVQKLLDELSADQQFREALAVDGFLSHVDMMARRGVEISKRGRNGLNLGYVGSYIYWGIEMLIIAVIACCGTLTAVSEPFCSECEMWKTGTMVGGFTGDAGLH